MQKVYLDKNAIKVVTDFIKNEEPTKTNLVPENIRKDVEILGVVGTYGGEQPAGLTPFYDGTDGEHPATVISTGDYYVFDTTKTDEEMLAFCQGLTYSDGICNLVSDSENGDGYVVAVNSDNFYAFMVGGGTDSNAGWTSSDIMTGAAGWQGVDQDGKAQLNTNVGTVGYVNPVAGWNGIIVGYEAGEQPTALTPIENGDDVSQLVIDQLA